MSPRIVGMVAEDQRCLQARVKFHVLLTSNEMVKREVSDLRRLQWECLIVDEGHRLKQKGELFTQLTGLSTKHRVLLTGQGPWRFPAPLF